MSTIKLSNFLPKADLSRSVLPSEWPSSDMVEKVDAIKEGRLKAPRFDVESPAHPMISPPRKPVPIKPDADTPREAAAKLLAGATLSSPESAKNELSPTSKILLRASKAFKPPRSAQERMDQLLAKETQPTRAFPATGVAFSEAFVESKKSSALPSASSTPSLSRRNSRPGSSALLDGRRSIVPRSIEFEEIKPLQLEERDRPASAFAPRRPSSGFSMRSTPLPRPFSTLPAAAAPSYDSGMTIQSATIQARPRTSLTRTREVASYERDFYKLALPYNPQLERATFTPIFHLINEILLQLKDSEFVAFYVIRDSKVGKNKNPEMQKRYEHFRLRFEELRVQLDAIGIKGIPEDREKKLCFWSGVEGQKRAKASDAICDDDVSFLQYLFRCWMKMQEKKGEKAITSQLPPLFSAIFADYAVGDVDVYISSQGEDGKSIVNANSAFWYTEAPILKSKADVTKINVYLFEMVEGKNVWTGPFDFKSDKVEDIEAIRNAMNMKRREDKQTVSLAKVAKMTKHWKSDEKGSSGDLLWGKVVRHLKSKDDPNA